MRSNWLRKSSRSCVSCCTICRYFALRETSSERVLSTSAVARLSRLRRDSSSSVYCSLSSSCVVLRETSSERVLSTSAVARLSRLRRDSCSLMNCFLSSSCVVLRESHVAHVGFRWKCSWGHRGNWIKRTTYLLKVEEPDGSGHGCNCIWRNNIPPGGGECARRVRSLT
jgi:hypothetical protein